MDPTPTTHAGESQATAGSSRRGSDGLAAGLARGFADGSLATLPMSAFMLAAQRAGAMGRQPPRKITDAWLDAMHAGDAPTPAKKALSAIVHFAFGGVAGAAFAACARRQPGIVYGGQSTPSRSRAALAGAAFGSLVWTASYMGWVPALGIMRPAHRDRPGRPWAMLAAHWIFGATLGLRTAAHAA